MIVPYTRFPSSTPGFKKFYRPILDVRFVNKTGAVRVSCHVDSGADGVLLHKDIANTLGIKWDSGILSSTQGISGRQLNVYLHRIQMEIINLRNSRVEITVGFVDGVNFVGLLGQQGFFDNFVVRFKGYLKIFDVENK